MDAEKRKLIVREIEHWRRSRLLPEQYCDFLMNLYVDDDHPKPKSVMGVSASAVAESNWKIWISSLAVIAAVALSALNFNSFGIPLQISIAGLFLLICYTFGFRSIRKAPIVAFLLFGLASAFLLFIGVYIMREYGVESSYAYVGYVAFASLVWLVTGLGAKMRMFQFCGWTGLLGVYGWLMINKLTELTWVPLEISWIPVSIILIWIAWLVQHKDKQAASVLLLVGLLAWFAPEGVTFLVDADITSKVIQLSFIGKLIAAGTTMFLLRKKWIEWVM